MNLPGITFIDKPEFFLSGELFDGVFPPPGIGAVVKALPPHQADGPPGPGVLCPAPVIVGRQPPLQIRGPAGVKAAVGAAQHVCISAMLRSIHGPQSTP